jgi:hypothetical protein
MEQEKKQDHRTRGGGDTEVDTEVAERHSEGFEGCAANWIGTEMKAEHRNAS